MTKIAISHPDPLSEKCLRLEAAGRGLARAMVTIPSVVKPGDCFSATVSLLDENAMPLIGQGEELALSATTSDPVHVVFHEGRCAACSVNGLVCPGEGFFRMRAEIEGQVFFSNPCLASARERPAILWGDPHIHTTVGDCHPERCRTRNLAYAAARYVYGLDFVAIADHISWNPRGTAGKWFDNLAACELYDEPGLFSTLYCYEASMKGGRGGDNNVYLRQPNRGYVDPWPDDMNAARLCEEIEGEFFVVPHHTTRTGKHGEIPPEAYPGERLMPVVEIHSKWGTSEYRGNPTPLAKIHPGPSYVQDLLARGYRLGFVGGTDSHTSLTFCQRLETDHIQSLPGLTAVMVDRNHRDDVFDAIRARRCYATCGERILLDVHYGPLAMGQSGPLPDSGNVEICVDCAAETEIARVEIIRNNKVVHCESVGDWKGHLSWCDVAVASGAELQMPGHDKPLLYYYVRVTTESGARAWSSPCWFELSGAGV